MAELANLKVKRGYVKAKLTRLQKYVNEIDTLNDETIVQLKIRLEKFEPVLAEFDKIQTEIDILDANPSTDSELFETEYFEVITKIHSIINKYPAEAIHSSDSNHSSSHNTSSIKLPVIKLPTFKGAFDQWLEFRDAFSAMIHNNNNICKSEKFYYLKSSLSDEALRVLQAIEVTDENYELAWKLLLERYENKSLIVFTHIKAIFELPAVSKESHIELRRLLDDITKHLRALEALKLPVKHWDALIIYILSTKLDLTTRREWEAYKIQGELPDMDDMYKFLKQKCSILEKIAQNKQDSKLCERSKIKVQSHISVNKNNFKCYFCKNSHSIYKCDALLKLPVNLRIQEIKNKHLCVNCLKPGHYNQECKLSRCKRCNKNHNTLLHIDTVSEKNEVPMSEVAEIQASSNQSVSCCIKDIQSQVLLSTAIIKVRNSKGEYLPVRALLDSGSQSHFVTTNLCERLELAKNRVNFSVEGVGQALASINHSTDIRFKSRFDNYETNVSCLVIPSITGQLPRNPFELKIPSNIRLADPEFHRQGPVDILLGAGIFWELLSIGQICLGKNLPTLQKTQLGWIVGGNVNNNLAKNQKVRCHITSCDAQDIDENLRKFWEIEQCSSGYNHLSKEENYCEEHFNETYERDQEGRFIVKMPLRQNASNLGDSRNLALERFYRLERKIHQDVRLRSEYVKFMQEYCELGHMSLITEDTSDSSVTYYLPHHPVIKESSSTTRLRVVFDASMKCNNGLSLNDVQYVGPTIQNDLVSIILRFRKYQYVMSADISKMYRQILIANDQRPLQRIIWRCDPNQEVQCYQLNTVTYGTASAPYLATRCLYQLALDNEKENSIASEVIKNDFYMDDLLTGADSVDSLLKIQTDVCSILAKAGFHLRKWLSNRIEVMESVQVDKNLEASVLEIGEDQQNRTLGIMWNANLDSIQFTSQGMTISTTVTKRVILSITSQIFDPLGLLGPVIIIAKIIIQQLWQAKLSWDEAVPQHIYCKWVRFRNNLCYLNEIKIPRWILADNATSIEIHGFSDASERGYGACVYIRCKTTDGSYNIKLLCAKSRVAPLKRITLPRLELCAAHLLAHLVHKIQDSLKMKVDKHYYWCDSTITLYWIKSASCRWKTFVANRANEIQELTNASDWQHVKSEDNPADLLSRGLDASQLGNCELWWKGPTWLKQNESCWDVSRFSAEEVVSNIPEERVISNVNTNSTTDLNLFSRYSSIIKLKRVTAYVSRFIYNAKRPRGDRRVNSLSSEELKAALHLLIRLAQQESYPNEYSALLRKVSIDKRSKLLSLNPILDSAGLLRVNGRLQNTNCKFDKIHPIILPAKHELTRLILRNEHERLFHCGPQQLLYAIREQFWPISGRNLTRSIVHKCVKCFRANPKTYEYMMGNLPTSRVNKYLPFLNTGIDYAGPILIKDRKTRGSKLIKAYICVFVCLSTKAMHLEVVTDLTTDAFLATLKRFIGRRGRPAAIYSDNATTFVGANAKLNDLFKFLNAKNSQLMFNSLTNEGIVWNFIPPRAPNFGGLWEAGVKSIKYHLKRVLGSATLIYEDLCTVLTQIESILNSRPLSPLSADPSDNNPLTPAHFLIGRSLTAIPESSVLDIKESRLTKYQRLQQILEHFWRRWYKEYLSELHSRTKWKSSSPAGAALKIGDLVVVKEDNLPPLQWALGRITSLHPGSDGVVRVVTVQLRNNSVKRAVSKICVLPIPDN